MIIRLHFEKGHILSVYSPGLNSRIVNTTTDNMSLVMFRELISDNLNLIAKWHGDKQVMYGAVAFEDVITVYFIQNKACDILMTAIGKGNCY